MNVRQPVSSSVIRSVVRAAFVASLPICALGLTDFVAAARVAIKTWCSFLYMINLN